MNESVLFSELYQKVISLRSGCSGCGICVAVCPYHRLVLENGWPRQSDGEMNVCPQNADGRCGLCARVCPRLYALKNEADSSETPYGSYRKIIFARTREAEFSAKSQDGGLASTIMKWGLQTNSWQSFIGYGHDLSWHIIPRVVSEAGAVGETCGSKYTYYPLGESLSALKDAGRTGSPYAVVGLPCQAAAMRRLEGIKSPLAKGLTLVVGLFCSETFNYQGLFEQKIMHELGIPLEHIKKTDIKKGAFQIEMDSGENHAIPLKELHEYGQPGCGLCRDFTAEEADISVGGLGIGGWNAVIIRSPGAESLMDRLAEAGLIETRPMDEYPKAIGLMEKMSNRKRQREWPSEDQ